MAYRIEFKPSAARSLAKLPKAAQRAIRDAIESLVETPRPAGVVKLAGGQNLYRIRVGDYRVIYCVRDKALLVLVVRVANRREAYR